VTPTPRPVQRIVISVLAAGGLVVGGALVATPSGPGAPSLPSTYDAQARQRAEVAAEERPHTHATDGVETIGDGSVDDGHGHVHDPATKNAISRSGEAASAPDPTTSRQRAASREQVARQRTQREPRLVGVPLRTPRRLVPEGRYAMAGGCYRLGGRPLTFQATGLGSYLLYAADRTFLAASASGAATWAAAPSPSADWRVRRAGTGRFTFTLADGRGLRRTSGQFSTGAAQPLRVRRTSGCAAFPEVETATTRSPCR